jgi:hypothetical protein
MDNLKKLIFLFNFIAFMTSCTEDEQVNEDCYTCETTQTEYCYTIGNTYYHTSSLENSFNTELNGASWSDTKAYLEDQCNGITNNDCYTCTATNTEYCYTNTNDFYTVSINETSPVEIPLNSTSWEDLKTAFEENCDNSQTASNLVGVWNLTNYSATETTVKTFIGTTNSTTLISYHTGYNLEYIATFTENPNNVLYSGQYSYNITGESEWVAGATIAVNSPFEWSVNGDNLEINRDDYDEYTTTILELTETTLKLKIETLRNMEDDYYTYKINSEIYETYEK